MKALIAGAGLGGLTAAACLIQRGHRVRIYEQAPELGEVGAGIQLSANSVKVMDTLGLRERLDAVAVRPLAYEFRRFDTGEMLHRVPLNEDGTHEHLHGTPYYHVHRRDLHSLLAEVVQRLDPDCITLSARTIRSRQILAGMPPPATWFIGELSSLPSQTPATYFSV